MRSAFYLHLFFHVLLILFTCGRFGDYPTSEMSLQTDGRLLVLSQSHLSLLKGAIHIVGVCYDSALNLSKALRLKTYL